MKILFIGGTGIISSACSKLVIEKGHDLYLFNRGESIRTAPTKSNLLRGDARDPQSIADAIRGQKFDVVVQWIGYTPDQIETDLSLFQGRTDQYVYISSASAYQTPPAALPVTESTPLYNPYWEYSRNKIACEERLIYEYRSNGFPITIVRPSHTYDQTLLPFHGGYTMVDRMRNGKPVIVHGDGTSLWVLTHHADFARGFLGLLGNPHAIGDSFHITSDELLSWNQIYQLIAAAAQVTDLKLVHIPSEFVAKFDPVWGDSLLGDKSHSMIFDNAKIKRVVPDYRPVIPFVQGAREIIAWYDANPQMQTIDEEFDSLIDQILTAYQRASQD